MMRTSDIFTAYISWPGGGKRRPAFVIKDDGEIVSFYKITTKYNDISDKTKSQYFPIKHYKEAGLRKQSYIDTINVGGLRKSQHDIQIIGRLTNEDTRELRRFLELQNKL